MMHQVGLPQFSSIHIAGYKENLEGLLKNNLEKINRLLKENSYYTWANLIYPLEEMEDALERYWSPLSHLHSVTDSKSLRCCYESCLPLLSAYEASIAHNHILYEAIKSIDVNTLNEIQQKIITDSLRNFELSGVALSSANKKRFEAIQKRLAELSNQFETNVLDSAQAFSIHLPDVSRLQGLPDHALHSASVLAAEKGLTGYVLNLEIPCFQAVITYGQDRKLREEMYCAYITRASDQGPSAGTYDNSLVINEILDLRHELANLLGFKNYAHLSLATKMAESCEQVLDFMVTLVNKVDKRAKEEMQDLQQFANKKHHIASIEPWDVAFLSEKRRIDLFNLSQEALRPYFPLPQVMQGLFAIVKKLYGMTIEEIEGVDIWHREVQCYCIIDASNQVRGCIYTDLFARQNKRGGAWMDSLQSRRKFEDGSVQFPIACLTCNFAKAPAKQIPTLSHDEVITLFHEFGHCLHHVLTQIDYLDASGINGVEWDAVELPSQFFENWCWDRNAIDLLTAHVSTHEALPHAVYTQLLSAKNFQSAMHMLRQMEFSLFDFRLHQEYSPNTPNFVATILDDVRRKTSLLPVVPYNRFQHSFTHIFAGGYAAGYYSYSWSEVLSSDAFARFEEEGVFNANTGMDFLRSILEVGGSQKAAQAFKAFKGREPTVDAFLRHNGINN